MQNSSFRIPFMTDLNLTSVKDTASDLENLRQQLNSEPQKKQLQAIAQLADLGDSGLTVLMEFLQEHQGQSPTVALGKAYQMLHQAQTPATTEFLQTSFPQGIVPLKSEQGMDYQPLERLLVQQDFQEADRLTLAKLCELAGEAAIARKWLYFSEVDCFPSTDLQTMDALWYVLSEGKFGFAVQRNIWLSQGKDFAKVWSKIGWKKDNNWTRYPQEFTWDLSAPKGHLPLSNQLRGSRAIASLLSHPAWSQD